MATSHRLRGSDVTGVVQLVGECRELWADAGAWQAHLLRGACRLTGTSVGSFTESRMSPDWTSTEILEELDLGWRDEAARSHRTRLFANHPDRVAFMPRVYQLAGRSKDEPDGVATALRQELRPDGEWYRSYMYNEYLRPAFLDGFVMSFAINRRTGNLVTLYVGQDVRDRSPNGRAKAVVSTLNSLVAPLVGVELASRAQRGLHGLSPRLRQVLQGLLDGDSEKQVAHRLGLTRPTVHEYVGVLYRHFDVSSRGELMAYFLRRRPAATRA